MSILSAYTAYYKQILKLGAPILVGQLGMLVVGFADNIMVGQYSTEALASASFVNNIYNTVIFSCIGFTYGILPLAGALHGSSGRGVAERIGALVRNAVAVNMAFTLFLTLVMTGLYFNLHRLGQPAELLPLIRPYYLLFLAGLVPVSLFNCFAQWSYAIKNTLMPMWTVLVANALNVVGNYALIYGHFGCPELGLTGAGISTLVSRLLCPAAMIAWFCLAKGNRGYRRGYAGARLSPELLRSVWSTSLPVCLQMTFESGSFSFAALVAGWIGKVPLAAFQIIVVVGMLGFTLYYAIGSAIAVLVSNEAGTGSARRMRQAGWAGYHVMLLVSLCSSAAMALFARELMGLFSTDPAVLAAGAVLVFPLVLYQLGDATQITFANALRGTSRVMPMLWIAFVSYIVIGAPATYIMAFPAGLGLYGIVLSFSVSLFLAGALFLCFFLRATRQERCNQFNPM